MHYKGVCDAQYRFKILKITDLYRFDLHYTVFKLIIGDE